MSTIEPFTPSISFSSLALWNLSRPQFRVAHRKHPWKCAFEKRSRRNAMAQRNPRMQAGKDLHTRIIITVNIIHKPKLKDQSEHCFKVIYTQLRVRGQKWLALQLIGFTVTPARVIKFKCTIRDSQASHFVYLRSQQPAGRSETPATPCAKFQVSHDHITTTDFRSSPVGVLLHLCRFKGGRLEIEFRWRWIDR